MPRMAAHSGMVPGVSAAAWLAGAKRSPAETTRANGAPDPAVSQSPSIQADRGRDRARARKIGSINNPPMPHRIATRPAAPSTPPGPTAMRVATNQPAQIVTAISAHAMPATYRILEPAFGARRKLRGRPAHQRGGPSGTG